MRSVALSGAVLRFFSWQVQPRPQLYVHVNKTLANFFLSIFSFPSAFLEFVADCRKQYVYEPNFANFLVISSLIFCSMCLMVFKRYVFHFWLGSYLITSFDKKVVGAVFSVISGRCSPRPTPSPANKTLANLFQAHFWSLFRISGKQIVYEPNFANFFGDFQLDILLTVLMNLQKTR